MDENAAFCLAVKTARLKTDVAAGTVNVYRTAQKFADDKRLGVAGREQKVFLLMDKVCDMCGDRFTDDSIPQTDLEKDFRNLVPCQALN